MKNQYDIKPCEAYRHKVTGLKVAINQIVDPVLYERVMTGYRVTRNGQTLHPAFPPLATREEAQTLIEKLVEKDKIEASIKA